LVTGIPTITAEFYFFKTLQLWMTMKAYPATIILLIILFVYFAIELVTGAIGSDASLMRLGAIPDSGDLHGQYWRLYTYSLLHSGYIHFLLNTSLLWLTGRIVERRVGGVLMISFYTVAVISGGIFITLWKSLHPTLSVSIGASDGAFGLLATSLVLLYRPVAAGFGHNFSIRVALWLILCSGIAISFLPGISFVGHLVGLVLGVIFGFTVPVRKSKENSSFDDLKFNK
jgi:membrane associated rhomboid family serine protease